MVRVRAGWQPADRQVKITIIAVGIIDDAVGGGEASGVHDVWEVPCLTLFSPVRPWWPV